MDDEARAEAVVRTTRGLADRELRMSYLCAFLRDGEIEGIARTLEHVCRRAEQAEDGAREILVSLADALNAPESGEVVQRLREQAAGESLLALERLVRAPLRRDSARPEGDPSKERVPDYGTGRTLTLGERKSLARRPTREMIARLLLDPHPEVIRRLLANPKLTEDDVVVLAAKRPCRPSILAEIARSPRWVHRSRVRLSLLLNPDMPVEMSAPIAALLVRPELRLVAESTHVSPTVRALCNEHLERRPPVEFEEGDEPMQ